MSKTSLEGLAIDGTRVPSVSSDEDVIVNPANGAPIVRVARAGAQDIDHAVSIASERFQSGEWHDMNSAGRGRILYRISEIIRARSRELAELESRNVGKPITAARGEIQAAANTFEFYAGAANKFHGETIPVAASGTSLTFREPLGVCALITPWNFPILIACWKIAPALAMGNTVVAKPASLTPLTALALADIAVEAGLPAGVLNVMPGSGSVAGKALVEHPLVRKISFTGSTTIGREVAKMAVDDIKRISLELGGKSANVIFADADLNSCIDSSVFAVYDNAGQDCCSRSRILVEEPVYDRFVDLFKRRVQSLRVGDPMDTETEIGPLITPQHRESVCNYIRIGEKEGARRIWGGEQPTGGPYDSGNYLMPTLFVDVNNQMTLMQEEIFGPVACILPFKDEEEAIQIANESNYGLSGSLWTRDIARALRFVRAWQTGMISVNSSSSVHIEAPFGGMKQSGLGREQGMTALEYYSEYKSVFINRE